MALDIGIHSDFPLTAAYSDLSNRISTGKSMTGGAGAMRRSLFGKGLFYLKLQLTIRPTCQMPRPHSWIYIYLYRMVL